jgi:2TM domain
MTIVEPAEPVDREQMRAVAQVQRWHDFKAHVGAYLLINAVLIVVWALTGGGTFWPGVSLAAWGLGLSSQHFLNSFSPISVDAVRCEVGRRAGRSEH